jgi:hypothetical protein
LRTPVRHGRDVRSELLIKLALLERAGADPRDLLSEPRRVNHQDLVMTAHPSGGEARFVAKGSHGHEGAPGNTRRSEPR